MSKWNYRLKCGVELRDAIHEEDCERAIAVLEKAYRELVNAEIIDDFDFDRYTEEFMMYAADGIDEDDANYELSEFYDLCDALGVWIPID